jgi:ABC-type transport system involved in multi-copper enzyme maturation permease subunit
MRWGLSPVFIYECLANSRRWQTYASRAAGVAILLVAIASIAMTRRTVDPTRQWREYAELGQAYFYAIIGVELTLVMLAAPAATAGAICVDRARGTLTHMLVTDLTDPEIVLGKLAARLLPILGLVACTWPVLAICSLLGGIDPTALTLAFAIILAVALVGCTMALALSVWARKPHEVVLVTYTFWILVLMLWPMWFGLSSGGWVGPPAPWSLVANPYYLANAPYSAPNQIGFWDYAGFFAIALVASALLILLAVWRMRPVARRGNVDDRKKSVFGVLTRLTRWLPSPSLDRNPVLWREWHRSRPSRWLLALVLLIGGATGIACVVGVVSIWANGVDMASRRTAPVAGIVGSILQLIFGLLMLSAVAPMSMSEERQRGSLDLLATTALSTRAIVVGKWLGSLRLVLLLALGPGLVALALATAYHPSSSVPVPPGMLPDYYLKLPRAELLFGAALLVTTILVHGALLASIGVAVATWIKRQSRAIAISVGLAVMINAGWPILIGISRMGMPGEGIACLSPVVAAVTLTETLTMRFFHGRRYFWWIAFWEIECTVMALGLLWLTVRTFDGCFGRIPERPRRTPVLSDVILVLAAAIGAGGLFGAITLWIRGFGEFGLEKTAIVACCVLITGGFALLSALAPLSIFRRQPPDPRSVESAVVVVDRSTFTKRWWETFRLVLVLAIGPAFLALALATARVPVHVIPKVTTLPGGDTETIETYGTGTTYVKTTDASGGNSFRFATDEEIAAAMPVFPSSPLERFLSTALVLYTALAAVLTILAHGAAFVSLGLALGIWIKGRGRAIAGSVSVFVCVTFGWPLLYFFLGYPTFPWGLTLASLPGSFGGLLLNMRHDEVNAEIIWWAWLWNGFFLVMSVVVVALAFWTLDRRSGAESTKRRRVETMQTAASSEAAP